MSDERTKQKPSAENRESRAMQDRAVTESRVLTEEERLEIFRQTLFQSSLPDLPEIPGWHLCWLTTTNPRDSIPARMRLGYEPVKPEDIPGWEHASLKDGEHAGMIGVNEMVAYKIPIRLYELYMEEAHHNMPMREEEKLRDMTAVLEQNAESDKSGIVMGNGTQEIGRTHRKPSFELT